MAAVVADLTSIRVTWTPPSPLGDTTGYIISYTSEDGSDSGSVTVSGGFTAMRTLTGLQNGATYTVTIIATSQHFPSNPVSVMVTLSKKVLSHSLICTQILSLFVVPPPDQPRVSVVSISATSISLSWSVASDSVVIGSEVVWREASGGTERD